MAVGEFVAALVAVGSAAITASVAIRNCCQYSGDEDAYELIQLDCHEKFDINEIQIKQVIGSGAFANVFKASFRGMDIALKCQKTEGHVLRERELLQQLHHQTIPRFIGAWDYEDSLGICHTWLATDLMTGGDLSKVLNTLSWTQSIQIALDVAISLKYLHGRNFIHRDIKASNILLDGDYHARICDFGFARGLISDNDDCNNSTRKRSMTLCGTDSYMAPEIHFEEPYDEKVDIFSYGIVLIELLCRRQVNKDNFLLRTPARHFEIDVEEFRSHVPLSCPSSLVCLAEMCVSAESEARPTASEIVEWLNDLKVELDLDPPSDVETHCSESDFLHSSVSITTAQLPTHEGMLLVRRSGPNELWTEMHTIMVDSTAQFIHGNTRTIVQLHECTLISEATDQQWSLLTQDDGNWQCKASSNVETTFWIAMLHHGIHIASKSPLPQDFSVESIENEDEVYQWLEAIGLSHFVNAFHTKGFTSMDFIRETGLEEDDFNFLGIDCVDDQATLLHAISQLRI